jgi:hypothetical protein
MKSAFRFLCPALVGLFTAGALSAATPPAPPAPGPVTVVFDHPEKFTDLKDNWSDSDNELGRGHYLPLIREYLEKTAARRLPAGQQLTVTFSDIDLAGDFEPWRGTQFDDVRIVKDIYVPRLAFTYKVTDATGKVVKSGDSKLVELGFQMSITPGFRDDPLRYEKAMLDTWLSSELSTRKS